MVLPHFLHLRRFPVAFNSWPIRVGLPQDGQMSMSLEISMAPGNSIFWPFSPCFFGRENRVRMFRPSTTTRRAVGSTSKTLPVLDLSLPAKTLTVSPFLIPKVILFIWLNHFFG